MNISLITALLIVYLLFIYYTALLLLYLHFHREYYILSQLTEHVLKFSKFKLKKHVILFLPFISPIKEFQIMTSSTFNLKQKF